MADVFISYSSKHRDLTERLAAVIEAAHGPRSVWWDRALASGDRFRPEITAALDAARAAVVVWTDGSVDSDWVYAEAVRAAAQRKIVTVREESLDPRRIPLPFNVFHADPVDMRGAGDAQLLAAIARRLNGDASSLPADLPGEGFRSFLLDPKQESLPPWAAAKRPASLLLAKHRLVPYDDIHGFVEEMVGWAIGTPAHAMGSPVLGRLVHGPGGLGKTRALIEVADILARDHGWLAGFVPRAVREQAKTALESLIARGGHAAGLLIVLDYAEGRQTDALWLADRIAARGASVARPARLVLLSRGAGDWWTELLRKSQSLQDLTSLGGGAYDVRELPERIAKGDRLAMFDRAADSFLAFRRSLEPHAVKPSGPSEALADRIVVEDDYDRPLAVLMAALLYAMGYDAGDNRAGMAGLIEKVLGLEYEHWDKALALDPTSNWPRAIKNGVAQLTLVGGVDDREAGARLLAGDPIYRHAKDIDVPRSCDRLALILPGGASGLSALEPDLIGEHHVAQVADDGLVDACLDWAAGDRVKRRAVLTVLNRATRSEHGAMAEQAGKRLQHLVAARGGPLAADLVATAVGTPGRLIDMLGPLQTIVPDLDEDGLAALDAELPQQSLALMDLSLAVAQKRLELARMMRSAADAADVREAALSHLATRADILGIRLSNLGRREEALAATEEATRLYRVLAEDDPEAYLLLLASGLNNLGTDLSSLGRREDAVAASQEAVGIYRKLAKERPDAFLPHLATSLNNTGAMLSNLGRREEALAASKEAVDIYRALAKDRPDAFLPGLARSLNNLGNRLSNLGRREEALAASKEAVDIYRALAKERPDAFLPDLARSLNNLGIRLSNLGRREEALAASKEAVDIYRALAKERPDAFLPDLAMSLNNLGGDLSNLGRREEALAASTEAVDIYRALAKERPDAFLPNLATSISVLSDVLAALERPTEAAAAATEALATLAPFIERYPESFGGLARTMAADVLKYSQAAGVEPDRALLDRIARAIKPR